MAQSMSDLQIDAAEAVATLRHIATVDEGRRQTATAEAVRQAADLLEQLAGLHEPADTGNSTRYVIVNATFMVAVEDRNVLADHAAEALIAKVPWVLGGRPDEDDRVVLCSVDHTEYVYHSTGRSATFERVRRLAREGIQHG